MQFPALESEIWVDSCHRRIAPHLFSDLQSAERVGGKVSMPLFVSSLPILIEAPIYVQTDAAWHGPRFS